MKLSVVIVSYNVRRFVEQCLDSVQKASEGIDTEVFVVDNDSADDTVEVIGSRYPWVHLIANGENLGFARANNIAIRQAQGEYVLLLNPDTVVAEPTLREAVNFMDAHPQAGGIGVRMHNADGTLAPESRRAIPTPWVSFCKMLGFSRRYYMSHLSWDEPGRIEVISGAFCLLRRNALDQIGLLDEDFFMYGEDIDLSFRLLKGGWENWYIPADIVHFKGESTQKSTFRYVHVFYQAMLIFFRKHYGHLGFFITLPVKLAIYVRALMALCQMQWERLRRSLGFSEQSADVRYIFVGSPLMTDACQSIATRRGLSAVSCHQLSDVQPVADTFTFIVYDASAFTYGQMLEASADFASRYPATDQRLATYHASTQTIVTPYDIIQ